MVEFATNRHLVTKFATNTSGTLLLLDLFQVMESISGSVVPLAMFESDMTHVDMMCMLYLRRAEIDCE